MKKFDYVITDELGLHARPAGMLVKEAKKFSSHIMISANGKSCEATRLIALMGMCIHRSDNVTVEIDGIDEEDCQKAIESFFKNNL